MHPSYSFCTGTKCQDRFFVLTALNLFLRKFEENLVSSICLVDSGVVVSDTHAFDRYVEGGSTKVVKGSLNETRCPVQPIHLRSLATERLMSRPVLLLTFLAAVSSSFVAAVDLAVKTALAE